MTQHLTDKLDYTSALAMGMPVVDDTRESVVNEIAPRPHDSGHHMLDACAIDQLQQQIRIIYNLPSIDTKLLSSCCMTGILGDIQQEDSGEPNWLPLQNHSNVHLHLYGKEATQKSRRMGRSTVLSADVDVAL